MDQCLDNSAACSSPQSLLALGYTYSTGTGPLGGPNNNGSPRSQTIVGAGLALTQTYTYDGWDRLTGMQETGSTSTLNESYCYDAFGNRAVLTRPGLSPLIPQVTSCTANEVALLFPSNRWSGRTYDAAGALSFDGQSNLRMDAEMRLRQSNGNATPSAITTYEYDGDGRRVAKDTVGGGRTVFVYDAFGQLTAEYGGSSDLGGTPPYSLHSDALGSTRLTTDLNGTVVRRTDYWPFGQEINSLTQDAPYRTTAMGYNSALRTPSTLFTGKERDAETGLDYFGARYLSSAQGRFVSPDPKLLSDRHITDPRKWNRYAYVLNSPLMLIDPNGLEEKYKSKVLNVLSDASQIVGFRLGVGPGVKEKITIGGQGAEVGVAAMANIKTPLLNPIMASISGTAEVGFKVQLGHLAGKAQLKGEATVIKDGVLSLGVENKSGLSAGLSGSGSKVGTSSNETAV